MLDKYKLGIDFIDDQHQKLFDLIDNICIIEDVDKNNNEKCDKILMENIIKELKEYSIYHFTTEENYFQDMNFQDTKNHINLHNIFIETINFYYENPNKLNKKKLYSFLQSWIRHHILIEDKKYTMQKYLKKETIE